MVFMLHPNRRSADVAAFLAVDPRIALTIPLMLSIAVCGFPSPADDYLDQALDFNELLVTNPPATFAVRIGGESMVDAGLCPGDIAIVNRALKPRHRDIVLALVAGEHTIKRLLLGGGQPVLKAENKAFPEIVIPEEGFEIWGVIKHSIRVL
jgi:DNA polymerase V